MECEIKAVLLPVRMTKLLRETVTLPEEFISYTSQLFGEENFQRFMQGMEEEPPVSIRLNPFKYDATTMLLPAKEKALVEWCPEGRYLETRPLFTFDPLLHAGVYYVQEAASMYVTDVMRRYAPADRPLMVLDLCAAPGGKSTALRSVLPEGSLLMTNEPMRQRANILMENVQKFGHPDVIVTNNYAIDYQRSGMKFDVILADVPCSGEGMFRKDEGAINEWSVANVRKCADLQRSIVDDIMPCLTDGGLLIYSTCTFNAHEDEDNVQYIVDEYDMEKLCERHFIPGITPTEGLYMSALRKPGEHNFVLSAEQQSNKREGHRRGKQSSAAAAMQGVKQLSGWLKQNDAFDFVMLGGRIVAVGKSWRDKYETAAKKLRVMHAGIEMGEQKGKDIIPSQSLALSTMLSPNAFPIVDVDLETALQYLRREVVTVPVETPRGFVVVRYKGLPLGFVKNLGNRTNNLYPQEWKIKTKK